MSPTTQLLSFYLDRRSLTLASLASQLAPKNPSRTLQKLYEVFRHDSGSASMISTLRNHLQIPKEAWQVAVKEEHLQIHEANRTWQRTHFTPHLWVELNEAIIPTTDLPNWLSRELELPDHLMPIQPYELPTPAFAAHLHSLYQHAHKLTAKEAERIAQAAVFGGLTTHLVAFPKEWIASFLYRHRFDLAFRFDPQGALMETVVGDFIIPNLPNHPKRL